MKHRLNVEGRYEQLHFKANRRVEVSPSISAASRVAGMVEMTILRLFSANLSNFDSVQKKKQLASIEESKALLNFLLRVFRGDASVVGIAVL